MARQVGENECAKLLSHTLGEEESTDYLLTAIAELLLQQLSLDDIGVYVNLETVSVGAEAESARKKRATSKKRTLRKGGNRNASLVNCPASSRRTHSRGCGCYSSGVSLSIALMMAACSLFRRPCCMACGPSSGARFSAISAASSRATMDAQSVRSTVSWCSLSIASGV
ncbi:MAG: hypothetical protein ABI604_15685 [Nitrospirota bacterium]